MIVFAIWPMVLALAFMVIIPLCATGVIKANRFVGIRWPILRSSEAAWERGHRAAIVPTFVGGALAIVAAIIGIVIDANSAIGVIVSFVFLLSGFGLASALAQKAAAGN
ncbi:MAG: SdpI/YfhL protein family [Actinomycetota bacterium]|jgi:hypothetical protein